MQFVQRIFLPRRRRTLFGCAAGNCFRSAVVVAGSFPIDARAVDFDEDGDQVAVASTEIYAEDVVVSLGNGAGTFSVSDSAPWAASPGSRHSGIWTGTASRTWRSLPAQEGRAARVDPPRYSGTLMNSSGLPSCRPDHAPLTELVHAQVAGEGHPATPHTHRPRARKALLLCIALTVAAMVVEIVGGLVTRSLMLFSDAAHMLSHSLALGVSYVALRLASRPSSARSHFGLYRAEILGAFLNGLGLVAFTAWIVYEAVQRLMDPVAVAGAEMTAIAAFGLVVNLVTAVILARAGSLDLNTRSALLHMFGDTLSSVAIVAGGVLLWFTGWSWVDPSLSIVVALVILYWSIGLLRQSTSILLERAPSHLEPEDIRQALISEVPRIRDVHDLHVWEITSGYVCLTAHVVVAADEPLSSFQHVLEQADDVARRYFHVNHTTWQLECPGTPGTAG